jgi:hypothetical protein
MSLIDLFFQLSTANFPLICSFSYQQPIFLFSQNHKYVEAKSGGYMLSSDGFNPVLMTQSSFATLLWAINK